MSSKLQRILVAIAILATIILTIASSIFTIITHNLVPLYILVGLGIIWCIIGIIYVIKITIKYLLS